MLWWIARTCGMSGKPDTVLTQELSWMPDYLGNCRHLLSSGLLVMALGSLALRFRRLL